MCAPLQGPYKAGSGTYGPGNDGVGICEAYPNAFDASSMSYYGVTPGNDEGLVAAVTVAPVDVRFSKIPKVQAPSPRLSDPLLALFNC